MLFMQHIDPKASHTLSLCDLRNDLTLMFHELPYSLSLTDTHYLFCRQYTQCAIPDT